MPNNSVESSILKLEDVNVWMENGNEELKKVNFQVFPGEIHSLVSLASEELSAFVDYLKGTASHSNGKMFVNGELVKRQTPYEFVQVTDNSEFLFNNLTISENIYLNRVHPIRSKKKMEEEESRKLLEKYAVALNLKKPTRQLTSEEQILVKTLRAFLSTKSVMVFRGCLPSLGALARESYLSVLKDMKKQGKGIIYVTSHIEDAFFVSDRISIMNRGCIVLTKDLQQAIDSPKEMMYALSGWSMINSSAESESLDALNAIVSAREHVISGTELNNELKFLTEDITKVLHAEHCIIWLADMESKTIRASIESKEYNYDNKIELEPSICELIDENLIKAITRENPKYSYFFSAWGKVNTIYCAPVKRDKNTSALLMLLFKKEHELDEMDMFYLSAFGKEIANALETAELFGRSALVQESHHRIKNSLQMIISLVYMQKLAVRHHKTDIDSAFEAIIRQISAIASVHNLLSKESGSESIINLAVIIREIAKPYQNGNINIDLDMENISIPYNKATTIAIIVNELLTNSVKYAFRSFSDSMKKEIHIILQNDGKELSLTVRDNGIGYPCLGHVANTNSSDGGMGISLIKSIITTEKGNVTLSNDHGAVAKVIMPISRIYYSMNTVLKENE